jgi:predicted nucleotidyltransferase
MENDKQVLNIKRLINQVVPYKKEIIFFGSRAKSNFRKDSDYDIFVVVHRDDLDRKELIGYQSKIKRLCAKMGLDADVIIRDRIHTESMKKFPGNIIHSAYQTGIQI